ncbi:hypothetical protein IHQ76_01795 [Bifidobacterium dentium]|uniref:hypothetical protein n=1 Tax=Bifidobacterium dentium TaxID=1689 RepID=UPI0018C27044|nr:hypothetical protein [Bifidobacterium dentium]MBF9695546.1 hypothetical protein [Bifidobacterium dentium]MBF9711707.1 hypothetical protein [Bifidobacterium dentium]MBF9713668.1 hypothetical protein [Bifidobacterium dentium]MBF9717638.1 hypothetical protein [Bifidobacterium dentium]
MSEDIMTETDAAQTEATNLPNWHVEPEPAEPIAEPEPETAEQNEPTEPEGNDKQVTKLRREAAKYRTELRETQSQLETANAQLTAARRQILANHRAVTGWVRDDAVGALLDGLDVASMFGEDGTLDADALGNAVQEQLKLHPYYDRKPGSGAMKMVLANHAPHVRQPVSADPLSRALRLAGR